MVSGIGREYQLAMGEMLDAVSDAANSPPIHEWSQSENGVGANDTMNGRKKYGKCLILFPTEDAVTFDKIQIDMLTQRQYADIDMPRAPADKTSHHLITDDIAKGWDVVVLDGTWSQARKMYAKYLQQYSGGYLYRVQLSEGAVKALDGETQDGSSSDISIDNGVNGHQLRRHPIKASLYLLRGLYYLTSSSNCTNTYFLQCSGERLAHLRQPDCY